MHFKFHKIVTKTASWSSRWCCCCLYFMQYARLWPLGLTSWQLVSRPGLVTSAAAETTLERLSRNPTAAHIKCPAISSAQATHDW